MGRAKRKQRVPGVGLTTAGTILAGLMTLAVPAQALPLPLSVAGLRGAAGTPPLQRAQSGYTPPPAIYTPYVPPQAGIGLPAAPGYGARNPPSGSGAPQPPQPGTPGWAIPAPSGSVTVVLPQQRPPCVVTPVVPNGCPGSPPPPIHKPDAAPKATGP